MPLLAFLIVLTLAFYLFYKIKYVRSKRPAEKKWLTSKSSIALGLFVSLFGINQVFLYHTMITCIIAAVFILFGVLSAWAGLKAYNHYLPHVIEEAKSLKD